MPVPGKSRNTADSAASGGIGVLQGGCDLIVVVLVSVAIGFWSVRRGIAFAAAREHVAPGAQPAMR